MAAARSPPELLPANSQIASAERDRADRVLGDVVVGFEPGVCGRPVQRGAALEADKGGPDLQEDRQSARGPASPWSYKARKHGPLSRHRGRPRTQHFRAPKVKGPSADNRDGHTCSMGWNFSRQSRLDRRPLRSQSSGCPHCQGRIYARIPNSTISRTAW